MPYPSKGDKLAQPTLIMKMREASGRRGLVFPKPHDQTKDLALIDAYKGGDDDAGIELLKDYDDVIDYIYNNPSRPPRRPKGANITFGFTTEDREDLYSTIVLHFFRLVDEYDPAKGPFEHMVRATLHFRVFVDFFEVKIDELFNEMSLDALVYEIPVEVKSILLEDSDLIPADHIELYQLLNVLTEKEYEVLYLSAVNEWDSQVVSEETGINRSTVRGVKRRAIKKIREEAIRKGLTLE